MIPRKLIVMAALMLPLSASADKLGIWVGGGVWDQSVSGVFRNSLNPADDIDVNGDLNMQDNQGGVVYAIIEHPIPILPNFKLVATQQEYKGSGTINATFNGINFAEPVDSVLNLDHADLTLYWQVIDSKKFELDFGLTGRKYDGLASIVSQTDSSKSSQESLDEIIPLVYGRVAVGFPIEGLSFAADANYISFSGNKLSDFSLKIAYQTKYVVGVEAGYRSQQLELEDIDEAFTDLKFDGPFANVFIHF